MLDQARCSVIIHGVGKKINEKDIEKAVLRKIGPSKSQSKVGKPYGMYIINMNIIVKEHNILVDANGDQRHRVYVRFQSENQVNQFMKSRPFKVHGKEFEVSRSNPKNIYMSGQITTFLSVKLHESGRNVSFQQKLT